MTRSPPDRARLVREQVSALEAAHRKHHRGADLHLLRKGFQVAEQLHHGQTRSSGDPFVTHPIAVAHIVAELGLDTRAVVAALLHDTVEDTPYTLSALRDDFGHTVAALVDGVTKLDKIYFGEAAEAETFRKMILAARADIRVLILKIADRLHNMRTLRHKPGPSRDRTAAVTRDIIIPLADRLGLYTIRRELDDLVLATLHPDTYRVIDDYLASAATARQSLVATARRELGSALRRSGIRAQLLDRPRHHYSIHREMLKHPQLGPQSPVRLVVIVNERIECYGALGAVHRTWKPMPGKFHDLIAAPKYNLYQSLHTTVIGPGDQPMDVLVRTRQMHRTAEFGIAADLSGPHPTQQPEWLDRLLAWQQSAAAPAQFLESLRNDLTYQQVTVHTSHGRTVTLPAGSTAVDLAYHLDADTADRLVSATTNNRPTPLTAPLTDGAIVELTLAHHHNHYPGPSLDWLHSSRTTHARLQIAQILHEDETTPLDAQIRAGRTALARALRGRDRALPDYDSIPSDHCGYPEPEALFLAIHQGKLDPEQVADTLIDAIDNNAYPPD